MYETETKALILQRMLDQVPVDIDKRQGAIIYDALSPAAIELAQTYIKLDNVLKWGFSSTTYGVYLDRRVAEVGLKREVGETDAALLVRYQDRVSRPAASGNKAQYEQWAKEAIRNYYVDQTLSCRVKVFPIWSGGGTVKVAVTGSDFKAALPALVTSVQTYIDPTPGQGEGKAPIGATVTVVTATNKAITVTFTVTPVAGKTAANVKAEFEPLLDVYLKELAFVDTVVRYSRVGNLVLDCLSAVDYTALTVNGGTGNVILAAEEVPVRGAVTVS